MGCTPSALAEARCTTEQVLQGRPARPPAGAAGRERPAQFTIRLHKGAGDAIGASLGDVPTGAVLYCAQEGGVLDRWNKENPDAAVRPGFIIEQVNGVRGYWRLLDELRGPGPLDVRVSTVPPPSAGPNWFETMAKKIELSKDRSQFMVRLPTEASQDEKELCGPASNGPIAFVKEACQAATSTSLQPQMVRGGTRCKAPIRSVGRGAGRALAIIGRSDNMHVARLVSTQIMLASGSARFTQDQESTAQQFTIASSVLQAAGLATFLQASLGRDPLQRWAPDREGEHSGAEPSQDRAAAPLLLGRRRAELTSRLAPRTGGRGNSDDRSGWASAQSENGIAQSSVGGYEQ
ncbi:unnamed protein product [Prorocentrum cordatum]|uniref:PDZ domain-containing protein n=1 Tax=Prorocentrum cordatum TaxID=2364126 RepID=A0ABN9R5N8_9DINO|nr:unnamed protein product [Polarella glacialis]